ncbi:STAS domain-containing protein, partial [Georgenia subflava]
MAEETKTPQPHLPAGEAGTVSVLFSADRTSVVLAGEVDAALATDLSDAISDAQRAELPVDVDVRHVTFMDSSGAAMLARLAARVPHRVRIIQPPDVVRFLLEVTAIGDSVDVVDHAPDPSDPAGRTSPSAAADDAAPVPSTVGAAARPGDAAAVTG